MFKQYATILCVLLFSCTLLNTIHAGSGFQEYLCTGMANHDTPMDMQLITKGFNDLEETFTAADLDTTISTPAYAAQLVELSDIAERYRLYRRAHNTFLGTLFLQQAIDKCLCQLNEPGEEITLQTFAEQLQERRTKTSAWLTAIRKSGEEHYVGTSHINIQQDKCSKKEFWEVGLKPVVLVNLKKLYYHEIYLNPKYMAILRTQYDSDLD